MIVFQDKQIKRKWHNGRWYFSVIDVVMALTDSVDSKDYWYRTKKRKAESSRIELSTYCQQLKLLAPDIKMSFTP